MLAVGGALVLAALLSGCGGGSPGGETVNKVDTSPSLEDAKQTAMSVERDLAAFVPAQNVVSTDQKQTGVLLSCEGERAFQWTGDTKVMTQGTVDFGSIVDDIVNAFTSRDGYDARRTTTDDGQPRAHIIGEYGATYLVEPSVDNTAINILSFSPCFVLPEDMSPRGEY